MEGGFAPAQAFQTATVLRAPCRVVSHFAVEHVAKSYCLSCADASGNVHVAWTKQFEDRYGYVVQVFYRQRRAGTGWLPIENLSLNDTGRAVLPALAVDADGRAHTVWVDGTRRYGDAAGEIVHRRLDTAGWSQPVSLSNGSGGGPRLAADSSGNVHVVWNDLGPSTSYLRLSADGPQSGAENIYPGPEFAWAEVTGIAADPSGNVHVVWQAMLDGGGMDTVYRERRAGSWLPAENLSLSSSEYGASWPAVAADSAGNVHIAWVDTPSSNPDVWEVWYVQRPGTPADTTPPVITPSIAGTLGQNGWYLSEVSLSWLVSEPESSVTSQSGCENTSVTTDTAGLTLTCTASSPGGTSSSSVVVKRDATRPTIVGSRTPGANGNGWNNGNVTVSFACGDNLSTVGSCSASTTLSDEGPNQAVTGTVTDKAGNTATATVGGISIDKTAPVVAYSGNQSTYYVDGTVNVACAAADTLSGIASTTCQNITGPAYSFAIGVNNFSATAVDAAGNTGSGSTSFEVVVMANGLVGLINSLLDSNTAGGLVASVNAIASAPNAQAKAGQLAAFSSKVDAQTGKKLSVEQAALLRRLVAAL